MLMFEITFMDRKQNRNRHQAAPVLSRLVFGWSGSRGVDEGGYNVAVLAAWERVSEGRVDLG